MRFLAEKGCKVNKKKLQVCQEKVIFLGHCILQGMRHLTEVIKGMLHPRNFKQLHMFLGNVSFCRQWIPHASTLMQPLYDCLKIVLYMLTEVAYELLITLDYTKIFNLYIAEITGHATGVLTQAHVKQRPVAYFSAALDPVSRGSPSCVRAVAAVSIIIDKSSEIVLDNPVVVHTIHDIHAILSQVQPKHLSVARQLRLQCTLLLPPNVTFQCCTTLNLATFLPSSVTRFGKGE